jgi:hypothetical protein
MGAPRSTGLPWHLGYPIIMFALICAATWSSAASLHLAAANSLTTQIRFGPKDYCGFNVTVQDGVRYYDPLGCVDAGWSYQVDRQAVGIGLPGAISTSLSKGAALLLVCESTGMTLSKSAFVEGRSMDAESLSCKPSGFVLLILSTFIQAYGTRYSFRKDPEPTKERLYTLISLHLLFANATTLAIWITFVTIAGILASATSYKGVDKSQSLEAGGIRIWWGISPWLILSAGLLGLPWAFESVRWRHAELNKS